MRISWDEFKEYALEFWCRHCEDGRKDGPTRKHDKCVEKCLKSYINNIQKDDGC